MTVDVEEWKTYLWVFFFSYGRKLGKIYTLQELKKIAVNYKVVAPVELYVSNKSILSVKLYPFGR